ncbi:hypothetical protein TRFO_43189 [Tritrichomonas foetus]|uniref:Uncharacterized protein n=1 Tax=Tritrichomonas foetus TaxID=1144522 RepID=A0A1J4KW65_9EUKA|nr:hypothetical protein TRFO_43189 [Tritrichomonas foetus]|eukprot:OHT13996.1 hypothetical protein TRFO_43189 [Tritrichomonas foetus]
MSSHHHFSMWKTIKILEEDGKTLKSVYDIDSNGILITKLPRQKRRRFVQKKVVKKEEKVKKERKKKPAPKKPNRICKINFEKLNNENISMEFLKKESLDSKVRNDTESDHETTLTEVIKNDGFFLSFECESNGEEDEYFNEVISDTSVFYTNDNQMFEGLMFF